LIHSLSLSPCELLCREGNSTVSFGHLCDSQFFLKFNTYIHILTWNLSIQGGIVTTAVDQPHCETSHA
jgi:hypothetical protein